MRRTALWIVLLAAAGCGGPSMMKLDDNVFATVTAEERAGLDASVQAIDQAKQKREQAKGVLEKLAEEKNQASREHDLAALAAQTAKAKVDWMSARQAFLKKEADLAGKEMQAAEANHQLQRAKLAQAKGLTPFKGFDARKFENQQLDYQKAYVNAQIGLDKERKAADDAEKAYQDLREKLDKARK